MRCESASSLGHFSESGVGNLATIRLAQICVNSSTNLVRGRFLLGVEIFRLWSLELRATFCPLNSGYLSSLILNYVLKWGLDKKTISRRGI